MNIVLRQLNYVVFIYKHLNYVWGPIKESLSKLKAFCEENKFGNVVKGIS